MSVLQNFPINVISITSFDVLIVDKKFVGVRFEPPDLVVIRPVNKWRVIALAHTHALQYLFRHASVAHAKLYMAS